MRIGVIGMPGRNKYRGQSIQTRFFIFGLPLFPTSCVYRISDNLAIEVPLTGKDIFHAFAKIHFGLFGLALFLWGMNMGNYGSAALKTIVLILSVVFIGLSIYSWLKHSDIKEEEEVTKRRVLSRAFIYNMPPEYLPVKVQRSFYGELLTIYKSKFGNLNWQETIKAGAVTKENFPLLFSLAHYRQTLEPSQENKYQIEDLWAYLYKRKELKTTNEAANTVATSSEQLAFTANPTQPSTPHTSVDGEMTNLLKKFSATQEKTNQEKTTQEAKMAPETAAKLDHIMKLANEVKEAQEKEKTAQFKTTANPNTKKNFSSNDSRASVLKDIPFGESIEMTFSDVAKINKEKSSMGNQMLMVFAFFLVAIFILAFSGFDSGTLLIAIILCLLIVGGIVGILFLPDYMKLQKDLKYRQKLRIKVRIQDLAKEGGNTYLVLKPNKYGISKLTASSKYYSTKLLNKDLDIFVSKEGHILLNIIGASY